LESQNLLATALSKTSSSENHDEAENHLTDVMELKRFTTGGIFLATQKAAINLLSILLNMGQVEKTGLI